MRILVKCIQLIGRSWVERVGQVFHELTGRDTGRMWRVWEGMRMCRFDIWSYNRHWSIQRPKHCDKIKMSEAIIRIKQYDKVGYICSTFADRHLFSLPWAGLGLVAFVCFLFFSLLYIYMSFCRWACVPFYACVGACVIECTVYIA